MTMAVPMRTPMTMRMHARMMVPITSPADMVDGLWKLKWKGRHAASLLYSMHAWMTSAQGDCARIQMQARTAHGIDTLATCHIYSKSRLFRCNPFLCETHLNPPRPFWILSCAGEEHRSAEIKRTMTISASQIPIMRSACTQLSVHLLRI